MNFILYNIVFIVVGFPSTYILDNKGLKYGIIIGSLASILGAWLRCLIKFNF